MNTSIFLAGSIRISYSPNSIYYIYIDYKTRYSTRYLLYNNFKVEDSKIKWTTVLGITVLYIKMLSTLYILYYTSPY